MIFRELASEFLTSLEEKKKFNDILLQGTGIKQKDQKRFKELANQTSNANLNAMLPQLKMENMYQSIQLAERQDKILALMKEDKVVLTLNKNSTQRRFFRSPSTKSSAIGGTTKYGANKTFLTYDHLA